MSSNILIVRIKKKLNSSVQCKIFLFQLFMPLHVSVFRDHLQRDTFTSILLEATITVHVLEVKIYTYNINNIQLSVKSKVFTTTAAVPIH